jgi:hypothetical protein
VSGRRNQPLSRETVHQYVKALCRHYRVASRAERLPSFALLDLKDTEIAQLDPAFRP